MVMMSFGIYIAFVNYRNRGKILNVSFFENSLLEYNKLSLETLLLKQGFDVS